MKIHTSLTLTLYETDSEDGLAYQDEEGVSSFETNPPPRDYVLMKNVTSQPMFYIKRKEQNQYMQGITENATYYLPQWQISPVSQWIAVNNNLLNNTWDKPPLFCIEHQQAALSPFDYGPPAKTTDILNEPLSAFVAVLMSMREGREVSYEGNPIMFAFMPIYDTFFYNIRKVVGAVSALINFDYYFMNMIPDHINGIIVVLRNTCGEQFTFRTDGTNAAGIGLGDLHESRYSSFMKSSDVLGKAFTIPDGTLQGTTIGESTELSACHYFIDVYPSTVSVPLYIQFFKTFEKFTQTDII
jgi:hypothetical protein